MLICKVESAIDFLLLRLVDWQSLTLLLIINRVLNFAQVSTAQITGYLAVALGHI